MIRRRVRGLAGACWLAGWATCLTAQAPAKVQVQMRNVAFHLDPTVILDIQELRGQLERRKPDEAPFLDDKQSFELAIDSALIGITPASLSNLLNHYTFAYPGADLRRLDVTIENGLLKQQGKLHGVSFTVLAELSLTPEGELRLHPKSIKAVGIKVGGLMKFFGLNLQKLVDTRQAKGVRVDKDDFVLTPTELLPPPRVQGRVGTAGITGNEVVLRFLPPDGKGTAPLKLPRPQAKNYMFFREGVLRFGKLTMHDTDLFIADAEPGNPFDFFLDHYNEQLVAGYSRNTPDHGLVVMMPDWGKVKDSTGAATRPGTSPRGRRR